MPPATEVFVGRVEIGAAWSKQSNEGRSYLGLKLDDPSFTAPIYANLFDDEEGDGYSLIWSRPASRQRRLIRTGRDARPDLRAGLSLAHSRASQQNRLGGSNSMRPMQIRDAFANYRLSAPA